MEGENAASSQQPTNHMPASTVPLPSSSSANPPPLAAPVPSTSIIATSTPLPIVVHAPQNPQQNPIQAGGIHVGLQQQQHPPGLTPTPTPTPPPPPPQQHLHQQTQIPNVPTGQPMHQTMVPTQANFPAGQPRQGMLPIRGRQQQQQQSQITPYSHFSPIPPSAAAMQQQRGSIPMQGVGVHSRPPTLGVPSSYIQTPRGSMGGQPQGTPNSSMISSGQADQVSSMQPPFSTPQAGQKQGPIPSGQTLPGIQSVSGMVSNPLSPPVRPSGAFGHSQQRPVQGSLRSQSSSQHQSVNQQKMHMPHFSRPPSAPVGSPLPGMSHGGPSSAVSGIPHQQQWMSSQGKQTQSSSLSSPPFQSLKQQNVQQRPHGHSQQQSHLMTAQQQYAQQMQEQQSQQLQSQRMPQPMQQPISRTGGLASQKSSMPSGTASTLPPPAGITASAGNFELPTETNNKILGKRQIQELLSQLDPHEKLDPDVEDIMIEIAEDFVDKVFPHACSLAKHRKVEILEPRDILLPLERYWNMTVPGFASDEYRTYKRPSVNENHKQRIAVIRRSQTGAETGSAKGSGGQATGNTSGKGQATKGSQEAPIAG